MISNVNLKPNELPLSGPTRLREAAAPSRAATEAGRATAWWWRGTMCLSFAYIIASQALLDIPVWSASAVMLAVLLGGVMILGSVYRVWKLRVGKWLVVPVLFLSYCLLRCFPGIQETAPFNTFAQLASAFLGGLALALALRTGVSFQALVYAQVVANLLQIGSVLFGLGPAPPPGDDSFRYAGMTGNANLLALQLTLGACFIWLLPRKAGVFPCVFAVGAVAFAVAVTGSRKAILIGLFFLVLMLIQLVALLPPRHRRIAGTLAVAITGLTGALLGPWFFDGGAGILSLQRTLDYQDTSYFIRLDMIQQGLQLWQQAPLFGNGLDAFRGLSGQGTYAHNNYVELLCDLGLLGTLLFYALHAQVLLRAHQARPTLRFYCWVFVVMLLLADMGYVSYTSKQSVMILMLLTVVTTSRYAYQHRRTSKARHGLRHREERAMRRRFVFQT